MYYNGEPYESNAIKVIHITCCHEAFVTNSYKMDRALMAVSVCLHQHHVGSHYGYLTRSLAPMINLSCEKFDSAHRIIVKRNLSTTQSRFYQQLVVERVRYLSQTILHGFNLMTILVGNASRSDAATSDACATVKKESKVF